ncbi:hypothetical protein AB1L30_03025, partial [Bremerella sp. JC817]|uniref:hypothetical protein n=1 Tax=Bremerella sp. JC817 TaxID=3231756 RepID=UPI003459C62E
MNPQLGIKPMGTSTNSFVLVPIGIQAPWGGSLSWSNQPINEQQSFLDVNPKTMKHNRSLGGSQTRREQQNQHV